MSQKWLAFLFSLFLCASFQIAQATTQHVNVNVADASQLQTIPGIGPKYARAIVEERERNGPFKDPEDLKNRISGIGSKSLKNLQANGLVVGASEKTPAKKTPAKKN